MDREFYEYFGAGLEFPPIVGILVGLRLGLGLGSVPGKMFLKTSTYLLKKHNVKGRLLYMH